MFQKNKYLSLPAGIALLAFLAFILCSLGCSSMPRISQPSQQDHSKLVEKCNKIFPQGKWRFIHTIQVNIAGKKRTKLIGITQVDSKSRVLHSVLMTIEGIVVFDAKHKNQNTSVQKATPPFDSPHFAKGLINNVKLIFLSPKKDCIKSGSINRGEYICRYDIDKHRTKDIHINKNANAWSVYVYNDGKKTRTLHAEIADSHDKFTQYLPPKKLYLKLYGSNNNYSLRMELVKAKEINTH
jgi:hypothetical protein